MLFRIGFLKGCSGELPRLVTGPIQAVPKSVTTHHPYAFAASAAAVREQRCECGVGAGRKCSGATAAIITVGFSPSHCHDLRASPFEARPAPYIDAGGDRERLVGAFNAAKGAKPRLDLGTEEIGSLARR